MILRLPVVDPAGNLPVHFTQVLHYQLSLIPIYDSQSFIPNQKLIVFAVPRAE
jgi:hypothetical protein